MSEHSSPWFVPNKPIQQVTLCCKIERQEAIKMYHSMMAMTRTLSTSSRCGSIPYTFELMELVPWLWLASESSLQLTMSYYRSSLYRVSQGYTYSCESANRLVMTLPDPIYILFTCGWAKESDVLLLLLLYSWVLFAATTNGSIWETLQYNSIKSEEIKQMMMLLTFILYSRPFSIHTLSTLHIS